MFQRRILQNTSIYKAIGVLLTQWNPSSKVDNLEPHILSIIVVGCPLWRGCRDVNGKQSGPRNFVRCIEVSVIEGCPFSGVPLYIGHIIAPYRSMYRPMQLQSSFRMSSNDYSFVQ